MHWRNLAFVVACAGGPACINFGSVSGGTPPDAGPGASDGQASLPDDGSVDGGSSSTGFCASLSPRPTLCDDFDEYETSTFTTWDPPIQDNGSVGLDTLAPFSKPNAMAAVTGIAQAGVNTDAKILKAFSLYENKPVAISISFEMKVEQWDTSASGQIIAFEVIFKKSPSFFNEIVLNLRSLGTGGVSAQIAENATLPDGGPGGYNNYPFQDHPVTGAWTKVEMTLNVPNPTPNPTGTQSNSFSVSLDGKKQIDAQPLQVPLQGGPPYIHLGIGSVQTPATAWSVHYDNFVANITPL